MSFCDREKSFACECMVDDGLWVIVTEFDSSFGEYARWGQPWVMYVTRRQSGEGGQPLADVIAIGVEPLALSHRIEYAEIWLGVTAASSGPLPASVVLGPIAVCQVAHEMRFSVAVVDQEMFAEKAGRNHPGASVHEPGLGELPCCRINYWITGASCYPRLPCFRVIPPREVGPCGSEGSLKQFRPIPE